MTTGNYTLSREKPEYVTGVVITNHRTGESEYWEFDSEGNKKCQPTIIMSARNIETGDSIEFETALHNVKMKTTRRDLVRVDYKFLVNNKAVEDFKRKLYSICQDYLPIVKDETKAKDDSISIFKPSTSVSTPKGNYIFFLQYSQSEEVWIAVAETGYNNDEAKRFKFSTAPWEYNVVSESNGKLQIQFIDPDWLEKFATAYEKHWGEPLPKSKKLSQTSSFADDKNDGACLPLGCKPKALDSSLAQLRSVIARQDKQYTSLSKQLSECQEDNAQLKSEIDQQAEDLAIIQTKLDDKCNEASRLHETIKSQGRVNQELVKACELLQAEVTALLHRLSNYENQDTKRRLEKEARFRRAYGGSPTTLKAHFDSLGDGSSLQKVYELQFNLLDPSLDHSKFPMPLQQIAQDIVDDSTDKEVYTIIDCLEKLMKEKERKRNEKLN